MHFWPHSSPTFYISPTLNIKFAFAKQLNFRLNGCRTVTTSCIETFDCRSFSILYFNHFVPMFIALYKHFLPDSVFCFAHFFAKLPLKIQKKKICAVLLLFGYCFTWLCQLIEEFIKIDGNLSTQGLVNF